MELYSMDDMIFIFKRKHHLSAHSYSMTHLGEGIVEWCGCCGKLEMINVDSEIESLKMALDFLETKKAEMLIEGQYYGESIDKWS